MKTALVLASIVTALPALAHADPHPPFTDAVLGAQIADWPRCLHGVDGDLHDRDLHATPDMKAPALTKAVGALAVGATPTGAELRAECLAQAKAAPNAAKVWQDELGMLLGTLRENADKMKQHPYDISYDTVAKEAAVCEPEADLVAEVLGADAQVEITAYGLPTWKGTIAGARAEICGEARQAVEAQRAKMLEPFVKAGIKNDKLKILEQYNVSVEIGVPGGTFTLDPKLLAKGNPWFSSANGDDCAGGHVITHLHRYQFDGAQKLIKESTRDYCGAVPKSAYR